MNKDKAIQIIWDYMHMHHTLEKADVIIGLGSSDLNTAKRAAELWLEGYAPVIIFSGSGTIHSDSHLAWSKYKGSTEAETYAKIAQDLGVPKEAILIENESQNTGQNFEFVIKLLKEKNITAAKIILVQKPTMERRTFATAKVWLPDVEVMVTSSQVTVTEYAKLRSEDGDHWIHSMVADLQRISEYPKLGYQIEQEIPPEVWQAYEYLVDEGFTEKLLK